MLDGLRASNRTGRISGRAAARSLTVAVLLDALSREPPFPEMPSPAVAEAHPPCVPAGPQTPHRVFLIAQSPVPIPTVTAWGLIAIGLHILTPGTLLLARPTSAAP